MLNCLSRLEEAMERVDPNESFGQLVRRLRKKKGLTLVELAERIGSHKGYVSGIENGKVNPPSPEFVRRLARVLRYDWKCMLFLAHAQKAPKEIRKECMRFVPLAFRD
jgi:transcriptional regulator with XRE-family HTH domain